MLKVDYDKFVVSKTRLGKFLRLPLRLIPAQMKLPILQGKLKGKQWIVGAGTHGCWLGTYEYDKQQLFATTIEPGSVVFDIGAHTGFYTLLSSVLVGAKGKVFAFEPLPRNIRYLRKHVQLNYLSNVTVMEAAVAKSCGVASFKEGSTSYQGNLSPQGKLRVATVSLDELIARGEIPVPDFLKIDVEGREQSVLSGAKLMLSQRHPTIFLAIHGRSVYKQCCQLLESLGYTIQVLDEPIDGELPKNLELIASYKEKEEEFPHA